MKINQVAAQLYTLRDYIQTPSDIAVSMKKVKNIGYEAVQVSGMGSIPENELMKILDGEGLICCATHEQPDNIVNRPNEVVERLNKLNCKYTAYPFPTNVELNTLEQVKSLALSLNEAGKVLAESGKTLTYHNHQLEFRRIDGKCILEWLYDETDPRYLMGEIDTFWIQNGGQNPTDWCNRLKNRLPLLHMKDYAIDNERKPVFAEIGSGNLDWKSIINAADNSGCEWFIVEQDVCPGDPFESLRISFDYIKENLCNIE